jgi:hypothetical protein
LELLAFAKQRSRSKTSVELRRSDGRKNIGLTSIIAQMDEVSRDFEVNFFKQKSKFIWVSRIVAKTGDDNDLRHVTVGIEHPLSRKKAEEERK